MRQPITSMDDHSRAVRDRFIAALEQGKTTEEATRIANFVAPDREPADLPPPPSDIVQAVTDNQPNPQPEDAALDAVEPSEPSPDEPPPEPVIEAEPPEPDREPVDEAANPAPEAERGDDLVALRAAYQAKIGKRPFMGWDAVTLKAKIAEAAPAQ